MTAPLRQIPLVMVVITAVDAKGLKAEGTALSGSKYPIDLSVSVGPSLVVPSNGERWYLSKIFSTWVLDRRHPSQNQALTELPREPGDSITSNPQGRLILKDSRGEFRPTEVELGAPKTPPVGYGGVDTGKVIEVQGLDGSVLGYLKVYQ